jgi:hypothetical protein
LGFTGRFTVEEVFEKARRTTGLDELSKEIEVRLAELFAARAATFNDGQTFIGRKTWFNNMVLYASAQLYLHDLRKRRALPKPDHPIQRVAIIGLPRTGTTHLHRLIASNQSAFQFIPFWEMVTPFPLPSKASVDQSRRDSRAVVLKYFLDLVRMRPHVISADTPDEDSHMFRLTTLGEVQVLAGFAGPGRLFEFTLAKLRSAEVDHSAVIDYCDIFRALASLQDSPRIWICKDPFVGVYLPTWLETFNNIGDRKKLIWTHREPVGAVTSCVSLCMHFRALTAEFFDAEWTSQVTIEHLSEAANNLMRYRDSLSKEEEKDQFLDVSFKDIQNNPVLVLQRIYAFLEIPFDDAARASANAFQNANPLSSYQHKYSPQQFHVDRLFVEEKFKLYIQRFQQFF